MHFELSRAQRLLADSVREFCQREFPSSRVRELMETEAAMEDRLWREFADQGWLGLHVSEQNDGLGLGIVDLAVLAEEFGRACVPGPWFTCTWAASLLQQTDGETARRLLSSLVNGTDKVSVAALEDDGDWQIRPERLVSEVADGRLTGHKQCVHHAGQADWLLLPVRCSGTMAVVVVPADADGVQIEKTPGIDPTRTLYRVSFRETPVADDQILATGGQAADAWDAATRIMCVVTSAESLGLQEWMLAATVDYVRTRRQFGRTVGSFQAVQHHCANMLQMTDSARAAVWHAAWAVQEETAQADLAASTAAAWTSETARRCGNLATQCHGGIGFTWEHDLPLYYRRAKACEFLLGDASFHREKLGRTILAGAD